MTNDAMAIADQFDTGYDEAVALADAGNAGSAANAILEVIEICRPQAARDPGSWGVRLDRRLGKRDSGVLNQLRRLSELYAAAGRSEEAAAAAADALGVAREIAEADLRAGRPWLLQSELTAAEERLARLQNRR